MQRRFFDNDDQFVIITPRDPHVVVPPTPRQGPPLQSVFIFNPNQPPPPVLATRFFTPPPWPENLEGENLTILPVVGPILALTEEQMETPPGFGRFFRFEEDTDPLMVQKAMQREEVREELREDRGEDRGRGRRGRRRRNGEGPILESETRERPTMDWPSGGGGE